MRQLFHTPEGVRDVYGTECAKKLYLQRKMEKIFHAYGYQSIETPTFEFFDVFGKQVGTTPSRELYKFFDRDGNTLVLRPDFTPSIARAASMYYHQEDMPIRLCYSGNTFVNRSSYQGRLKESTQMGVELLGDASVDGDGEIIAMTVELLKAAGLKEFQISIGQVDFFKALVDDSGMSEETIQELRQLISNKNYFGVEELLENQRLSKEQVEALTALPQLFGGPEVLKKAESLTGNPKALAAIRRLRELYQVAACYGCEEYISFDLGMLSKYQYYTGIIFQGFTYGTGEPLVTGGRYNKLLEHFGRPAPAIGFCLVMEQVLNALNRQNIKLDVDRPLTLLLYYPEESRKAIACAGELRSQGGPVELCCMAQDRTVDTYRDYASRKGTNRLCYYKDGNLVAEFLSTEQ